MLRCMNRLMAVLCAAGLTGAGCAVSWGQSGSNGEATSTNTAGSRDPAFDRLLQAVDLVKGQLEQTTTVRLLEEMAQEHTTKADEASRNGQAEKASWEGDLAKSLRQKAASFSKSLADLTSQLSAGTNVLSSTTGTNGFTPDEAAYLGVLDVQLSALRQQCEAVIAEGRTITAQLGQSTNSTEVARVSALLQDNRNELRELQREQFGFELKVLEFRALYSRHNLPAVKP